MWGGLKRVTLSSEVRLKYRARGQCVAQFFLLAVRAPALRHALICFETRKPFIMKVHWQAYARSNGGAELARIGDGGAFRSVHIDWQANHQRIGSMPINGLSKRIHQRRSA